eukprot:SAG31_NODE_19867_length_589_cov_3.534694_1_plen_108_part_10
MHVGKFPLGPRLAARNPETGSRGTVCLLAQLYPCAAQGHSSTGQALRLSQASLASARSSALLTAVAPRSIDLQVSRSPGARIGNSAQAEPKKQRETEKRIVAEGARIA